MTQPTLDHIDATIESRLERLFEFIRIPSVSTDPAPAGNVARAEAPAATLRALGAQTRIAPAEAHRVVVSHLPKPHVLFDRHCEVPPPVPPNLRATDPCRSTLRDVGVRILEALATCR